MKVSLFFPTAKIGDFLESTKLFTFFFQKKRHFAVFLLQKALFSPVFFPNFALKLTPLCSTITHRLSVKRRP